jgi:hypothetical protein
MISSPTLTYFARSHFGRLMLPLVCLAIIVGHVLDFFVSWTAFAIYLGLSIFLVVMVLQWVDINIYRQLRVSFEVQSSV